MRKIENDRAPISVSQVKQKVGTQNIRVQICGSKKSFGLIIIPGHFVWCWIFLGIDFLMVIKNFVTWLRGQICFQGEFICWVNK